VVGVRGSRLTNRSSPTTETDNVVDSKFLSRITCGQKVTDDQLRSFCVFYKQERRMMCAQSRLKMSRQSRGFRRRMR